MMSLRPTQICVAEPVQIRYQQYSLDERRNVCVEVCPEIPMLVGGSGFSYAQKKNFPYHLILFYCRADW